MASDPTFTLTGLEISRGAPADRRATVRALSPEDLADRLARMALEMRDQGLDRLRTLARFVDLPLAEVVASPFGLRAVALAARDGVRALHHEVRAPIPWAEELLGPDSVASGEHGEWVRGVLQAGKYEAFCQDEPLSSFNPNHMSKWGPHELLHRVVKCFWRADMTRWELYLGARLNELLPVALWYGPDEVLRLNREGFDREREAAAPDAVLHEVLWLTDESDTLHKRARRTASHLIAGLDHFERELTAIDREVETGACVPVEHPFLHASSDAIAYTVGHWARLTAGSTRRLFDEALRVGRDYVDSIPDYRALVEAALDALLFDPISLDLELASASQSGRLLWDLLFRTSLLGARVFDRVSPLLPEVRTALDATLDGKRLDLPAWRSRLQGAIGPGLFDSIGATGDLGADAAPAIEQLTDGLCSIVPATVRFLEAEVGLEALLSAFCRSRHFKRRAPLAERWAAFLRDRGLPAAFQDLIALERAIAGAIHSDDRIEHLAEEALTPNWMDGLIVKSEAVSLVALDFDVGPAHAELLDGGTPPLPDPGPMAYLVGRFLGDVAVIPAPPAVRLMWEGLKAGPLGVQEAVALLESAEMRGETPGEWPASAEDWLLELMGAGAVAWAPRLS